MKEGVADTDQNHTTPPRTAIVLGAGASASDEAPVQSELFRGYFQSQSLRERVDPQMQEDLKKYFNQLWGINIDSENLGDTKFPTFEEALGLLEIAHSRGEFFKGLSWSSQTLGRAQELRSHLMALIALILKDKLSQPNTNHISLIRHLHTSNTLSSTVFISLNYDILIDNAIELATNSLPNYGVNFKPQPTKTISDSLLLKIHGSLNWMFCTICNTLSLFPGLKAAAQLPRAPLGFRCSACHEVLTPIIIPPTFFKVMSNIYLQQIWKKTEEALKRAERIVFCGYSFPDADIHLKYILKRAEVNRSGLPPSIYIVNEHSGKTGQEQQLEKERYERFFRDKESVHFTKLFFEEFASKPNLIEDQSKWL